MKRIALTLWYAAQVVGLLWLQGVIQPDDPSRNIAIIALLAGAAGAIGAGLAAAGSAVAGAAGVVGGGIAAGAGAIGGGIGAGAGALGGGIAGAGAGLGGAVSSGLGAVGMGGLGSALGTGITGATGALGSGIAGLGGLAGSAVGGIGSLAGGAIGGAGSLVGSGLGALGGGMGALGTGIGELGSMAYGAIGQAGGALGNMMGIGGPGAGAGAGPGASWGAGGGHMGMTALEPMSIGAGDLAGTVSQTAPALNIPLEAAGGALTPAQEAVVAGAGELGPAAQSAELWKDPTAPKQAINWQKVMERADKVLTRMGKSMSESEERNAQKAQAQMYATRMNPIVMQSGQPGLQGLADVGRIAAGNKQF